MTSLESVTYTCCRVCGVALEEIRGNNRTERIVLCRELIVCIARVKTNKSFPQIAKFIRPGKSHSTLVTMQRRIESAGWFDKFTTIHGVRRRTADLIAEIERKLG